MIERPAMAGRARVALLNRLFGLRLVLSAVRAVRVSCWQYMATARPLHARNARHIAPAFRSHLRLD